MTMLRVYRLCKAILKMIKLQTFEFQLNGAIFKKNSLLILALGSLSGTAFSQTLRGVVRAADNNEPLTGATVNLFASRSNSAPVSLATNPDGEFTFENLKAGYYHAEVSLQDFETTVFNEILIAAGKEQVLEIALRRSSSTLPEVTIAATTPGRRSLQPMSEIPLTRDQTLRFPAMYFDPGRLAAAYPGVSQIDDGTNHMSIRGNSPATVRWRIEGLDIVNPNHLPNAGTFTDAPAAAGGGVLMFSAQMLDNSSLLTGAFPAGYGDAVSGVMDMNLRAGNTRQHEFTAQAGLIGLDVAAEGPFDKNGKSSYLANYRYSTVGLLGQLGVSFGDEQINFQDLSFHLHSVGKKGGQYSFFGMGGLSNNIFRHKTDSAEIKYDKDFYDIDFKSQTGVIGGSAKWLPGAKTFLKTALIYSVQKNDWSKDRAQPEDNFESYDHRLEQRLAASVEIRHTIGQSAVSAGIQATQIAFADSTLTVIDMPSGIIGFLQPYDNTVSYLNLQPWARWTWNSANGHWFTDLGAQFHYNSVYQKLAPAPRGLLSYRITPRHRISLSAGFYREDGPVWLQFVKTKPMNSLSEYRPDYYASRQAGIRYSWTPDHFWKASVELFYQHTGNIPARGALSPINNPEYIDNDPFVSNAVLLNKGVELSVERALENGWFVVANGTIFRSKYKIDFSRWLDSRWDIGHLANVTFGKEWLREKSASTTRTIGVGLRAVWAGGPREADINYQQSVFLQQTVFDETNGYYRQYPDYFRADIRVYWKRSLGDRRNSTFALDIQNVTGQQNLAYHFYDPFTGKIENKFQLGPIPNFSWRLEF